MLKTTIIFVRHCEADNKYRDDKTRLLTERGYNSISDVTRVLSEYPIDKIYSSPYKRTLDTIGGYAKKVNKEIIIIEDFRERYIGEWIDDFETFVKKQWGDLSYTQNECESLLTVQKRNIKEIKQILKEDAGKTIAIATHGCALSTILNYFNNNLAYDNYMYIRPILPYIIKIDFEKETCIAIEEIFP